MAGLTRATPRVAPGQLLKPRGTPVYKRLYSEHADKLQKLQDMLLLPIPATMGRGAWDIG